MNAISERIKNIGAAEAIGIVAVTVGCYRMVRSLVSLIYAYSVSRNSANDPENIQALTELFSVNFYISQVLWFGLLVYLPILYGVRLIGEQNKANIKCAVAILSVIISFRAVIPLLTFVPQFLQYESISILLVAIPFFPIYILATLFVFMKQGLEPLRTDFITKRTVLLSSWMLFFVGFFSVMPLTQSSLATREKPTVFFDLLGLVAFVPMICAYYFHKFGIRYVERIAREADSSSNGVDAGATA